MILTREITIKVNSSNIQYFDDLGYDPVIGEEIKIPVELLSKGSHHKIKCECDGCGLVKDVIFKNYVKYDNQWGYYFCRKCAEKKRKISLKESWGVEYPIQNREIFSKMRKSMIKRKVVDSISS